MSLVQWINAEIKPLSIAFSLEEMELLHHFTSTKPYKLFKEKINV